MKTRDVKSAKKIEKTIPTPATIKKTIDNKKP